MDSKIILTILIVALIGVVAATYNNEATEAIQTLTNVATEEDSPDSATDILDSDVGSNSQDSLKVDEDTVKPDSGTTKKTQNNKASSTTNGNANQNSNKPTSTANNKVKPSNTNNSNNQQINSTTVKISSTQAKEIAIKNLPEKFSKAVASNPKLYDKYYEVTLYMGGEAIGYYEIDAYTGAITGGAFKDEVPNPTD